MSDKEELVRLIQTCDYHALKAVEKHEFYTAKSTATYRQEAAKNALDWAALFADIAGNLTRLFELEHPTK